MSTFASQDDEIEIVDFSSLSQQLRLKTLTEIKRIEKKTFPQSEALNLDAELKKSNTSVLVAFNGFNGDVPRDLSTQPILGYMVFQRMKRVAFLHKLCVAETYRSKGIGRKLMNTLGSRLQASACDRIHLWVDLQRPAALKLYNACGYEQTDMVPNYYGPGRDAYKMTLQLAA